MELDWKAINHSPFFYQTFKNQYPGVPWWCSSLRIQHCHQLWCRLQTRLGSCVTVAVVQASSYSSDLTPSLGTTIYCVCGPKKTKNLNFQMIKMHILKISFHSSHLNQTEELCPTHLIDQYFSTFPLSTYSSMEYPLRKIPSGVIFPKHNNAQPKKAY